MQIGEVASFQNGYAFKSKDFVQDGKYKIIKIKELKDGKVRFFNDSASVNVDDERIVEKYIAEKGDVLFALTGDPVNKNNPLSWVGRVSVYEDDQLALLNQRVCKLVPKEGLNAKYIYYYFRAFNNFYALASIAKGSASQANISTKDIEAMEIALPSLDIQNKIVSVLDSIEKKINQNNKINKNLEQQAKAIFKSWFVDFEPFGSEQPSEMQFVPLQDICKVVTKGTTPTTLGKPFTTSGINFIKAESILDNHSIDNTKFAYIDDETNTMLKRSIIESGDIVFTIAGTLGRFALIDESVLPANTNQAVAIIRPDTNKVAISYLYSFFIGNWHNDYYTKRVQQAVQANLSLTTIKSLPIAILSNESMKKYDDLVRPLFAMMKNNEEENRKLSNLRDTLLPKLMSGELDVSNIDL